MNRWASARREIALISIVSLLVVAGGGLAARAASGPGNSGDTVADVVLGQLNFTSNIANTADPSSMSAPEGLVVDTTVTPNRVYVSDSGCNRILGWASVSALANGQPANIVIGQPSFTICNGNSTGLNASSLSSPDGLAVDAAGNLYVADLGNNRVLVYPKPFSSGFTAGQPATLVFGQNGNFTSNSCNGGGGPTASTLCVPDGIGLDKNGNVYISERNNVRVLEFDNAFATSNTKANRVFGQCGSFTTNISDNNCAKPPSSGPPSANNFTGPLDGIAINPSTCDLWVSDEGGNRVLEFLNPTGAASCSAKTSGTTANLVLGQPGFTTNNCNNGSLTGPAQLCTPKDLHVDSSGDVFVSDGSNNRTLMFPAPAANGAAATIALGQSTTSTFGGCNPGGAITATSQCFPIGVGEDSAGEVFLSDNRNNRVLKYSTPLSSGAPASLVLGEVDFAHNSGNFIDASALNFPLSPYVDAAGHLYVADQRNHRVLGWKTAASLTTGQAADIVLGQPDFEQNACNNGAFGAAPNAQTLCNPEGLVADSAGNLWVGDTSNSRVLRYPAPFTSCSGPCTFGEAATLVIGKANFTSGGCDAGGITASTLCSAPGVGLDANGNLYVADFNDSRVLFYATPLATGMAATQVFGQANFTTNGCNTGGLSAITLCNPNGLSVDTSTPASPNLWVADYSNHRVLMYLNPQAPASGGCPSPGTPGCAGDTTADLVLGQGSSFTTNTCRKFGGSQDDLCNPGSVTVDFAGNVYVADDSNNRSLFYLEPLATGALKGCATPPPGNCTAPGTPGSAGDLTADRVFGQADDFSGLFCNFNSGNSPSADSLCTPSHFVPGLSTTGSTSNPGAVNSDVYVSDANNHRVLKYLNPQAVPGAVTFTAAEAFGNVAQNNTSLAKTDTFSVPASSTSITFTFASISGTNASDFKISSNACSAHVVAPGGSCKIAMTFTPTAAVGTAETATLTLHDNASNSPHTVTLTGTSATQTSVTGATGTRPSLTLAYGTVTTSSTKTVTLINNQAVSLTGVSISAISGPNAADFAITTNACSSGTVAAFKSCAVSVKFTPTLTTTETAQFTITDSPDSQSATTIAMSGQK